MIEEKYDFCPKNSAAFGPTSSITISTLAKYTFASEEFDPLLVVVVYYSPCYRVLRLGCIMVTVVDILKNS